MSLMLKAGDKGGVGRMNVGRQLVKGRCPSASEPYVLDGGYLIKTPPEAVGALYKKKF